MQRRSPPEHEDSESSKRCDSSETQLRVKILYR